MENPRSLCFLLQFPSNFRLEFDYVTVLFFFFGGGAMSNRTFSKGCGHSYIPHAVATATGLTNIHERGGHSYIPSSAMDASLEPS